MQFLLHDKYFSAGDGHELSSQSLDCTTDTDRLQQRNVLLQYHWLITFKLIDDDDVR